LNNRYAYRTQEELLLLGRNNGKKRKNGENKNKKEDAESCKRNGFPERKEN